jgi:hypothetical protein
MIMKAAKLRIWKEMAIAYFKVLERKRENKIKVRIASKLAEIQIRYLQKNNVYNITPIL